MKWTPERIALFDALLERGDVKQYRWAALLNELDGLPIIQQDVYNRIRIMRLQHRLPPIPSRMPPRIPTEPLAPTDIDWRAAMDWAERNGVRVGRATEEADLAATNARRTECGLPPFRIGNIGNKGPLPKASVGGRGYRP